MKIFTARGVLCFGWREAFLKKWMAVKKGQMVYYGGNDWQCLRCGEYSTIRLYEISIPKFELVYTNGIYQYPWDTGQNVRLFERRCLCCDEKVSPEIGYQVVIEAVERPAVSGYVILFRRQGPGTMVGHKFWSL